MSSLIKSLQRQAPARSTDRLTLDVPPTFLGFLEWIGVVPQPGQAELVRVAFDRAEPVDRALAVSIFGDIDFANVPVGARDVVAAVCGGRGGKTYLLVALRLVWGMLVRDLSPLAPGQQAAATVVAPSPKLRQEAVNYALGAIRSKKELAPLLRLPRGTKPDDMVGEFGVYRPDFDRVVLFNAAAATRGGYAVRGYWHTDLALDEAAFFRDNTYKVNDEEIFRAGKPRVLPGGQTMVDSTPWAETGLLFDLWQKNWGKPTSALVAHAPTLVLNDVEYTRSIVAAEYARDPENAEREFGAKFMTGGTTVFFPPALIEAMVDDELDPEGVREPEPGNTVAAGGDLGFRSDSSSLAITHDTGETIVLAELLEMKPEPGKALKPSVVIAEMAERMHWHGAVSLMGDQHYRETADEGLNDAGLSFVDAPATPDVVYIRARQVMREGRARIPRIPRLIQQLKEVQGRPLPGGRMQIVHPRWAKGGHGDLCSAYVLALWQLCSETIAQASPLAGSREWEAAQMAARRKKLQDDKARPKWQPANITDRGKGARWRR
jgi:hypothetical protein